MGIWRAMTWTKEMDRKYLQLSCDVLTMRMAMKLKTTNKIEFHVNLQ